MDNNIQKETAKENVHNQHDKGYKFLLSSKRVFIELLRSFVRQEWVKDIDETDIVKIDKSYILQDFADKEADLVYRMKLKDKDVIFYVLMELQSTVDFQMPYRLLLYDVNSYNKKDLLELENLIGAVFLLDQKIDREELMNRLSELIGVLKKLDSERMELFKTWLGKILSNRLPKKEKKEIERIIEESKEVEDMVYNLERTILEGFKEYEKRGIEKGIEKRIEKGIGEVVIRQLKKKFSDIPEIYIGKIRSADKNTLINIADNIFEIKTLDDLDKYLN